MNEYSMAEVKVFYEKSLRQKLSARADFIEGVIAGIGGAFSDKSGYKNNIVPLLESLRGDSDG